MFENSATNSSSTLPVLDQVKDWIDKSLFFIMFIAGFLYMIISKLLNWPQWLVTIGPVSIIIAYGIIMTLSKRYHIRADKGGDNLYYLGFLFTLISLGMSLIGYSSSEDSGVNEQIISNFGIALSTTIAGMAGRVFMNQMREDIVDIEVSARVALTQAVKMMRSEMLRSVEDINLLRKSSYQSINESKQQFDRLMNELCQTTQTTNSQIVKSMEDSKQELADMIKQFATDTLNSVNDSKRQSVEVINGFCKTTQEANRNILEDMGQSLKAATNTYADTLSTVLSTFEGEIKNLNTHAAKLTKNTEKIVNSSDKLWQRLDAIKAPSDILDQKLDTVTSRLSQGASNFEASTSALQAQTVVMNGVIEKSEVLFERLTSTVAGMQSQLQTTSEVNVHIRGIGDIVGTLHSNISNLNQSISDWMGQQQQHSQTLKTSFQEDINIIHQHRDKTKEVADNSVQVLSSINTSAKSLYQSIGLISTTLAQLNEGLGKLTITTDQTAKLSEKQSEVLQKQYIDLKILTQVLESQAQAITLNLKQIPDVQNDFKNVSQYFHELEGLLSNSSKALNETFATHKRVLTAVREQLDQDVTLSRKSREALQAETARIREASTEMNTTLVSLANSIVESLNAPRTS